MTHLVVYKVNDGVFHHLRRFSKTLYGRWLVTVDLRRRNLKSLLKCLGKHGRTHALRPCLVQLDVHVYKPINWWPFHVPTYISNFQALQCQIYLHSAQKLKSTCLQIQCCSQNSFGDRDFSVARPRSWNDVPQELRHADISFGQYQKHAEIASL